MLVFWLLLPLGTFLLVAAVVLIWKRRGESGASEFGIFGLKAKNLPSSVAVGFIGLALIVTAVSQADEALGPSAVPRGEVLEIVNPPPFPDIDGLEQRQAEQRMLREWLLPLWETRIIVSLPNTHEVRRGDYAVSVPDDSIPDETIEEDELGRLANDHSVILQFDQVFDNRGYANIKNLVIDAFVDNLPVELQGGEIYFPLEKQQSVFLVSSAQSIAYDRTQALLSEADQDGLGPEVRLDRQERALKELREYRSNFGGSLFSPSCLFDEGFLLWKMGRPDNAKEAFELFLSLYPRHFSAPGAEEHIRRIMAGELPPNATT